MLNFRPEDSPYIRPTQLSRLDLERAGFKFPGTSPSEIEAMIEHVNAESRREFASRHGGRLIVPYREYVAA